MASLLAVGLICLCRSYRGIGFNLRLSHNHINLQDLIYTNKRMSVSKWDSMLNKKIIRLSREKSTSSTLIIVSQSKLTAVNPETVFAVHLTFTKHTVCVKENHPLSRKQLRSSALIIISPTKWSGSIPVFFLWHFQMNCFTSWDCAKHLSVSSYAST